MANLPYIPSGKMAGLMPDVRDFEPAGALDGGPDGLDLIRRLLEEAPARLAPGAHVLLEAEPEQMPALETLLAQAGFSNPRIHGDLSKTPRFAEAESLSKSPI